MALQHSDRAGALEHLTRAEGFYRQLGSAHGEASVQSALGDLAVDSSEHAAALQHYEQALAFFRRAGYRLGEANCLCRLGKLAFERNELARAVDHYESALRRYESALELHRRFGDLYSVGRQLALLAEVAPSPQRRDAYRSEAIATWVSLGRGDLAEQLGPSGAGPPTEPLDGSLRSS